MTIPLFLMSFFYYGPRPLLLALVAVIVARIADRVAAALRVRPYDKTENSSVVFALIIVLMMPASVPIRVVVVAVLLAILVAKEAFGGYRSYPFNPAAVGFCMVAVSWPEWIFRYPAPQNWLMQLPPANFQALWDQWTFKDAALVEGPSHILKTGGLPNISTWNLLLGNYAGPLGVGVTVVLLACAVFLLVKKRVFPIAPLCFILTACLIAYVFPRYNEISFATWPGDSLLRLQVVGFELLGGALLFVAIFMVSEPGTMPRRKGSQVVYGVLLGLATMLFHYFGIYELGVCFAILLVNAFTGFFDRAASAGGRGRGAVANEK